MSKNGIGILVLLVSMIVPDVTESETVQFISAAGTGISFVLMVWNQLGRKDVWGFLFKRK